MLIAYLNSKAQYDDVGCVDVLQTVLGLRAQRAGMIANAVSTLLHFCWILSYAMYLYSCAVISTTPGAKTRALCCAMPELASQDRHLDQIVLHVMLLLCDRSSNIHIWILV